jgi:hypothetical protein
LLPDEKLTWYKAEYNNFGNDLCSSSEVFNFKSSNQPEGLIKRRDAYFNRFDEMNNGLADNYSISKGGTLVKSSQNLSTAKKNDDLSNLKENSYLTESKIQFREHDLRSIWIPKKFNGRNVFLSHIESTLFPEKEDKTRQARLFYLYFIC